MNDDPPSSPLPATEAPRELPRFLRTFQSLAVPGYRNYTIALFLYFAAMQSMTFVRPWLAYELSADPAGARSPLALGVTIAAGNLPSLVISPWAGALADRFNKRAILQGSAALMGVLSFVLGFGVVAGVFTWWHVAIVATLQGSLMMLSTPARRSLISDLVEQKYLLNAVALSVVNQNVNRTIMPAIAGFVIVGFGPEWALWTITAMYGSGALAMFSVPTSAPPRPTKRVSMGRSIAEGFGYARRERVIRNLLVVGIIGSVFGQPVQQLLPLFQDVLHINADRLGLLTTFMGIGSLMGATTAASLGDFRRKGLLLIGFFTFMGVAVIAFSASSWYLLSLFLMIPIGIGNSGRNTVHNATIQAYTEPAMRGRIVALSNMETGFAPVAVLGITALASVVGPQWALASSGLLIVTYGLWEIFFARTVRNLK